LEKREEKLENSNLSFKKDLDMEEMESLLQLKRLKRKVFVLQL
jgi:hypothetical protein